eukprot:645166-Pelagomonas_calceolata.AAC.1
MKHCSITVDLYSASTDAVMLNHSYSIFAVLEQCAKGRPNVQTDLGFLTFGACPAAKAAC